MSVAPKIRVAIFDKNMNILLRSDPLFKTFFGDITTLTDFNAFLAKNEMLNNNFTTKLHINDKEYHLCCKIVDMQETYEFHFFLLSDEWIIVNPSGRHDIYDQLTGLLTERSLLSLLEHEINKTARDNNTHNAIIIDISHLQDINEAFGYLAGDSIIKSVANTLRLKTRKADVLGRYHGDKFIVILHKTDNAGVEHYIKKLENELHRVKYHFDDLTFNIKINYGIASIKPGDTLEFLLQRLQSDLLGYKKRCRTEIEYFK
jgi:diguanylate cyclase (GGDEF)-like protein